VDGFQYLDSNQIDNDDENDYCLWIYRRHQDSVADSEIKKTQLVIR